MTEEMPITLLYDKLIDLYTKAYSLPRPGYFFLLGFDFCLCITSLGTNTVKSEPLICLESIVSR